MSPLIEASPASRIALVTGAGGGIGAATARVLAARGHPVAVNYLHNEVRARSVVESLRAAGGHAVAFAADVTDERQVHDLVEQVESRLGPIDILVANAPGIRGDEVRLAPVAQLDWADVGSATQAQIQAFFHPVRAVLPGMLGRGRGSIIAVGAAASRRPVPGFLTVSMAKAAIEIALKIVAREVGTSGVRVNGVGPGLIVTDIGRLVPESARVANAQRSALGRNGQPEDVANAVAFLASDEASYLTGTYLLLDGGTAML